MLSPDWIDEPLDLLLGYSPGMSLPQDGRPWHPAYSPNRDSEEDFWVRMHRSITLCKWYSRMRTIDRLNGKRALSDAAMANGRDIVRLLITKGLLDMSDIPTIDRMNAEEALGYCVAVIRDGVEATKNRLVAAKTVLEFTRQKPVTKAEHTITAAEDFLNALDE
jgi:hypothetical protein